MNYTKGEWKATNRSIGVEIANIWYHLTDIPRWAYMTDNEAEADAHLIAAAPAMYEALKEIAEGKGAYSVDRFTHAENTIRDMKALAIKALAKAEGKE